VSSSVVMHAVFRRGRFPTDLRWPHRPIARVVLEHSRVVQRSRTRRPLSVTALACLGLTGEGETNGKKEVGGRSRPRIRSGPRASTGRRPRRWPLARNSPGARRRANCSSTRQTGSRYRRRKPTSSVYASSRESLLVFVVPRVGHRVSVVQEREGNSGGEEQQGRQERRCDG
jgi:hypothetical protein